PIAFFGWLRSIVDRAAAAHRNTRSRRRESPMSAASHLHSPNPGPAEVAEESALSAQVRRAMQCLTPRDRVIVELFYFEDMSCREAAEFLRTTRDAVKTSLHRARAHMRKEMMTMTTSAGSKTAQPAITRTMSGGGSTAARTDLLFEHDSRTARFYLQLYPIGEARKAARALGMTEKQSAAELAWLQARKLVAPEGKSWRCTMPVMSDRDLEIIRPWAEEVAAPVTDRLDDLHRALSEIAEEAASGPARDTVLAVGLYAEVARRPFMAITRAMETSVPDRGEFGERTVAAVSAQTGWPEGYGGLIQIGDWHSDQFLGVRRYYFLWPHGTDRSDLNSFCHSVGQGMIDSDPKTGLVGLLCSLGYDPISIDALTGRAADFGLKLTDADSFLSGIERLRAVTKQKDRIQLAIPVAPHTAWQPFLDELDSLSERTAAAVADAAEDLRQRMLRCSFAECSFADSVGLCMELAHKLVSYSIRERDWVRFPGRADFSWGVMFVY
ncbi:MAG: sigma-70 family RNA polymerase sigma factor, partial [Armatimonadota bacterium]